VAFSPDGRSIATGDSADGTVRLWDVATGQALRQFNSGDIGVIGLAFSPDGRLVASAAWDQTLRLWDAKTGSESKKISLQDGFTKILCFSPDGKFILRGTTTSIIEMWDIATGQKIKTFSGHKEEIRALAYAAKGDAFLSSSMDGTVKWWDVAAGQLLKTFAAHKGPVVALVLSKSNIALSGSEDKAMKVWDIVSDTELFLAKGHTDEIASLSLSGNHILGSGSFDKSARVWEICTAKETSVYPASYEVGCLAFQAGGKRLITGSRESLKLWDTATGKPLIEFKGHTNTVRWATFSKDGSEVYSVAWDATIRKWKSQTGERVLTITAKSNIESAILLEEKERILCGHWNGEVTCWNTKTGELISSFKPHILTVTSMGFVQGNKYLLTGSEDETIQLWDTSNWTLVKSEKVGNVKRFTILPYREIVAIALPEKRLEFWSLFPFQKIQSILQNTQPLSLSVTADEKFIIVGNTNGTIYLYNALFTH
jgi:WD40 repeat protein